MSYTCTFLRIEKAKVHLCGTKVSANSVIHGHMKCIKFDWRKIPLEMQRFVHLEVPLHFLIIRTESLRERSRFHQNYRISPWWIPLSEVPKFKYVWIQEQYFERKTHLTPIWKVATVILYICISYVNIWEIQKQFEWYYTSHICQYLRNWVERELRFIFMERKLQQLSQ